MKFSSFERSAGVLMPLSAMPSAFGIGCFSKDVEQFADIILDMGFHWWQVLPITTIGWGNSPYSGLSTHAGNSLFINPYGLAREGLLTEAEAEAATYRGLPYRVDYDFARENISRILKLSYTRIGGSLRDKINRFREEEGWWLEDYALFMAISAELGTQWWTWENGLSTREESALSAARTELKEQIDFYVFEQYIFFSQWLELKKKINDRGVGVIGDLPFYVATDSADVWANPHDFVLDQKLRPTAIAGVPPDAFASNGQIWGNCLYDFKHMKQGGYIWWRRRISHCLKLYDALRLDHFRAFYNYFSIPASDVDTAVNGHWEYGPGVELIDLIRRDNPDALFIAEDLGLIDPGCREFIDGTGIPTMRVFQFGFDGTPSEHIPYRYGKNNVAYTATHDNNTTLGWLYELNSGARDYALKYCGFTGPGWGCGGPQCGSTRAIIKTVAASSAVLAVFPIQDMLGYGSDTRINIPGTPTGNWEYRLPYEQMLTVDRNFFLDLLSTYGRNGKGRA